MPTPFSSRVLALALSIPRGRVTTYGRIARAAGGGGMSSQSITGILGKARDEGLPGAERIPFHRIVYADGRIWIHADAKRRAQRLALYRKEGIRIERVGSGSRSGRGFRHGAAKGRGASGRGSDTKERIADFAEKVWEFK